MSSAAVSAMPRGCHDFSRNDLSILHSATVLGSGHLYISAKDVHHLVVDMPRAIVENTSTMHYMSYIVASSLSLDEIRIDLLLIMNLLGIHCQCLVTILATVRLLI